VGDAEIYRNIMTLQSHEQRGHKSVWPATEWSRPLADLAADGWELLTTHIYGHHNEANAGVSADFFLKRATD